MPYINVNDAYILDNTGKQVDDAVDYALANSNRNLLDNWWFINPVNQLEVTNFTNGAHAIERWMAELSNGSITLTSAGLVFQGDAADLYQPMDPKLLSFLDGKTLTASILRSDGTIETGSKTFVNGQRTYFISNATTGADIFISQAGNFNLRYLNRTTAITVVAAKLELGSYSTLANDTPPDFEAERRKCMAFCQLIQQRSSYTIDVGFGELLSGNCRIFVPTSVPMRYDNSKLTVAADGTAYMYLVADGSALPVTSVSVVGVTANGVILNVSTSGTLTANKIYALRLTNNSARLVFRSAF